MQGLPPGALRLLADHTLPGILWLQTYDPTRIESQFEDYHGFEKVRLSNDFLAGAAQDLLFNPRLIQPEVVRVTGDLTDQVHVHDNAFAHCVVLGAAYGCPDPSGAYCYLGGGWSEIQGCGQIVLIPPGTPHGFTVRKGGVLWFLSVQSPPIKDDHGYDDYHKLAEVPLL